MRDEGTARAFRALGSERPLNPDEIIARANAPDAADTVGADGLTARIVNALRTAKDQIKEFGQPKAAIHDALEDRFSYFREVPATDPLHVIYKPTEDPTLKQFIDGVATQIKDIRDPHARTERAHATNQKRKHSYGRIW